MEDDFDYNDTAQKPATQQEFLMENLCGKKGQSAGGYSAPAPRSASKRWKNIFEQNIMLKLDEKHAVKKQNVQLSKEAAREIIRKIPVELLAKEWLSKEDATVDMRAYLVDNVLPTLVLGVERLLKEVDEKGLSATNRFEPEFNPINYLAQYLMRNNPRFSNFAEASPYVRGLREVSEEIKQELFTFEDNRLARIKAEARRKRAEREKHEQQLMEARENRKEQLITQFQQWNIPTDNNRVPLCLIQNALRSFVELVDQWPTELREAARFGCPLDPTDETGITLSVDDFAQYISKFVQDFSMDVFEEFMLQMSKCAAIHRSASERENRRVILTNLFLMCDHGGLGLLDRLRILQIMEEFWDDIMNDGELKGTLRNPRRWPVIEVEEIDDSMFDAWEHEPDGGLTMNEIFQAENDLARINQEVHRSATIASVHDKTAMEKWKIKQLSEKSEGMRWKLYKYNVTDFLNVVDYSYLDTLEAPKRYMMLENRADMSTGLHHDLHLMSSTKTRDERDVLMGRNIQPPEVAETGAEEAEEDLMSPTLRQAPATGLSAVSVEQVRSSSGNKEALAPSVQNKDGSFTDVNSSNIRSSLSSDANISKMPSASDGKTSSSSSGAKHMTNSSSGAIETTHSSSGVKDSASGAKEESNSASGAKDATNSCSVPTDENTTSSATDVKNINNNHSKASLSNANNTTDGNNSQSNVNNTTDGNNSQSNINNTTDGNNNQSNVNNTTDGNNSQSNVNNTTDGNNSQSNVNNTTDGNNSQSNINNTTDCNNSQSNVNNTTDGNNGQSNLNNTTDGNDNQDESNTSTNIPGHVINETSEENTISPCMFKFVDSMSSTQGGHVAWDEGSSPGYSPDPTRSRNTNNNMSKGRGEASKSDSDSTITDLSAHELAPVVEETIHTSSSIGSPDYATEENVESEEFLIESDEDLLERKICQIRESLHRVMNDPPHKIKMLSVYEKADNLSQLENKLQRLRTTTTSSSSPLTTTSSGSQLARRTTDASTMSLESSFSTKTTGPDVKDKAGTHSQLEQGSTQTRQVKSPKHHLVLKPRAGPRASMVDRSTSPYKLLPPIPSKKRVRFKSSDPNRPYTYPGSRPISASETHAEGSRKLEDFNTFNEASKSEKSKLSITSTSDIDRRDLLSKLSLPTGDFLNFLYKDKNINFNKQLVDVNINSCQRVRDISVPTNQRSQSQLSAFNENFLNMSQFVHLIETYLGNEPSRDTFEKIVKKIRDCYVDTEEEKMERMMLGRREMISAKRKLTIDNLFEKWDNDGSGFLEMEEVQEVLFKYKDGQELDGIKKAQAQLRKKYKYQDQRLSKSEFRDLIELAVKEMPGAENFEQLVEFLLNSVERSYAERIRGEARKKWLKQIVASSHYCGTQLDPVYKAVFQALYKDAETHGGEKRISANISMLEANKLDASRGKMLLRYAACTPEDCPYMLGKALFKNMKGVSFQAVESGKPVHVPRVSNHGSIYFWNYNRTQEEREGSFVAVPIKDSKKRVFGILGIDTICDPNKKSIFITHEIQFFQGVAKAFSIAFHAVELRRKLVRVFECASAWIARRCKYISEIDVYLVEPNMKPEGDPVLRKLLVIDKKGNVSQLTETHRLERKDNLFRSYLFQCMENSETIVADIYGERHTALPLRNLEGLALGIIDINIGEMKKLPPHENKEIQRMLRLLQKSLKEILKEGKGEDRKKILDIEKEDEASRINILFDSLMLAELRENVAKLDPMAFAELRSYITPPRVITDIIRATLAVFDVEKTGEGQYDDWHTMKNCINTTLVHQIKTYDPTKVSEATKIDKIARYLKALPHGEIGKYGSIPAMLMYNWVFCIHSIIDYTLKLRDTGHQAPSKTESRVNAN